MSLEGYGKFRGNSGRERLKLGSRLYVALSDSAGRAYSEVRVFTRVADLRREVFNQGNPGQATFIGFATQWEARVALEAAGVNIPAELAGGPSRARRGGGGGGSLEPSGLCDRPGHY